MTGKIEELRAILDRLEKALKELDPDGTKFPQQQKWLYNTRRIQKVMEAMQ